MGFLNRHTGGKQLVVFEMANNHMGDIDHGVRIIEEFAKVASEYSDTFQFAFKFQYRDLDTFIHPDHKGSDIKYVKRFEETRLNSEDWQRLIGAVKTAGMLAVCTPFDEASVPRIVAHGFDILKIASCSLTDWPLLEEISKYKMPIIASVAGSSDDDISNVNAFFSHRAIDYVMLYCVGLYPTETEQHNIAMVGELKRRYPNLTVGISTHEHPTETTGVAIAVGAGAEIFEKHVALPTEEYRKNAYSVDLEECAAWLESLSHATTMFGSVAGRSEIKKTEASSLRQLMRAVFAKTAIAEGELLTTDKLFFAIPSVDGGLVANDLSKFRKIVTKRSFEPNEAIKLEDLDINDDKTKILEIRNTIRAMIEESGVIVPANIKLEISHHYGLDKFDEFGLCMLTVLNKRYCKKLLFVMPGQNHPEQYHKIKHESFHIFFGSIELKLDGVAQTCKIGDLVSIPPGVKHEFSSSEGAVIEELSTEHMPNDSLYVDDKINQTEKRKSYVELV